MKGNSEDYGNAKKSLVLNQNQYDALFSYFYSNGAMVFSDLKYNEWKSYKGEYALRAEARKELRDYLIDYNKNYSDEKIIELFVKSKGGNINHEYEDRRRKEAIIFNTK